ncbi:uncharacterized protein METZ01_LOCUS237214, partial [marine metagenome]
MHFSWYPEITLDEMHCKPVLDVACEALPAKPSRRRLSIPNLHRVSG